ncbi:uncharacterized protein BP01DRAFT_222375 [Aspergillus saccharolyticus JOP 1030-1]|uniref:Uncharacterized protein n=1 Tax=Aspergillus saccharolyticus JOP 1030-1 TaxID=1450539 RepID=A0A318Z0E2_9EURO|nr:hypothetical protein BP01DRAFT_222375 [Aspergillus saccharolyticus JOP 1030-1]PYH40379.1 hypothetical protein BP01DRAFT_222375 [Aspergillus saccharolyticus JOP 1030-1]
MRAKGARYSVQSTVKSIFFQPAIIPSFPPTIVQWNHGFLLGVLCQDSSARHETLVLRHHAALAGFLHTSFLVVSILPFFWFLRRYPAQHGYNCGFKMRGMRDYHSYRGTKCRFWKGEEVP